MTLFDRIVKWLDSAEGRTLTLISANADFEGPSHLMEYSTLDHDTVRVEGETREEIIDKIWEATCDPFGPTAHNKGWPKHSGKHGHYCWDYDGLWICEDCGEWETCSCFNNTERKSDA